MVPHGLEPSALVLPCDTVESITCLHILITDLKRERPAKKAVRQRQNMDSHTAHKPRACKRGSVPAPLFLCSQNCPRAALPLHWHRIQTLPMQDLGCFCEMIKVFSVQPKSYLCKNDYFLILAKLKTIIAGMYLA